METGLDFAQSRNYATLHGRFTSPDLFLNDTWTADPASWNLYAYVRSNPLRYTDPTGEIINVRTLSSPDRLELLARIDATYGRRGVATIDENDNLRVDTTGLSAEVKKATQYLTDAINSTAYFAEVQVSNNDSSVAFGQATPSRGRVTYKGVTRATDLIVLDFADDRWVSGDDDAGRTFLDTVFAHEVAHRFPRPIYDPKKASETGPVVDAVNVITDALGRPRRAEYSSRRLGEYWRSSRFERREVDKKGQVKMKSVYIQWLKKNVGGKGVN